MDNKNNSAGGSLGVLALMVVLVAMLKDPGQYPPDYTHDDASKDAAEAAADAGSPDDNGPTNNVTVQQNNTAKSSNTDDPLTIDPLTIAKEMDVNDFRNYRGHITFSGTKAAKPVDIQPSDIGVKSVPSVYVVKDFKNYQSCLAFAAKHANIYENATCLDAKGVSLSLACSAPTQASQSLCQVIKPLTAQP